MSPREWFRAWIEAHKTLNPHGQWPSYEQAGFKRVYRGWVRAFRDEGITQELAEAASEQMQREPTIYPEKHLARVVKLAGQIRREAGAREIERAEAARKAEAARRDRIEAEYRRLWEELPGRAKEQYRREVRAEFPWMVRFEKWIENLARHRWADTVRGIETVELAPAPEVPAVVRPREIVVESTVEPERTPGQLEFLAALTPGEREAIEAMTPARRQMLLAAHADGFNKLLLPVVRVELASSRKRAEAETPHAPGEEPTRISVIETRLEPAV